MLTPVSRPRPTVSSHSRAESDPANFFRPPIKVPPSVGAARLVPPVVAAVTAGGTAWIAVAPSTVPSAVGAAAVLPPTAAPIALPPTSAAGPIHQRFRMRKPCESTMLPCGSSLYVLGRPHVARR